MPEPESTTRILARCLEEFEERGEEAIEAACARYPSLADRLRASARILSELLGAVNADSESELEFEWNGTDTIGRFLLGERIGKGGMGVVYKAFDPKLKRVVALKLFPAPADLSTQARERFRREGEALAQTRHPHIVPVHEVGETDDHRPYLVMPFIEGQTLAEKLAELDGDVKNIARIIADAAGAVHHAHEKGLVHRDVKPANILVDGAGMPFLIDFGLARSLQGDGLTRSGTVLGTPAFMAPEQIRDPGRVGPLTDVYALGATLYQCLTQQLPFQGETHDEIYDRICRRDPVPPRQIRGSVPRDLETICLTAMEKEPARRYDSAAELQADLERFLAYQPVHARPLGRATRAVRWTRRNRAVATAITLALLVVVLGPTSYAFYMRSLADQEHDARNRITKESEQKEIARAEAAYRAGRLLAQRGRWADALRQYSTASEHHPDPVLVAIARIEALEGSLDAPAAIRELEAIRKDGLSNAHRAKLLLLEADLGVNRFTDPNAKMDLVDEALALGALGPADTLLAKAMKCDSVASALELLREARRIAPYHRRINDYFGVLLLASGRLEEVSQFSRELEAIYPDDPAGILLASFVRGLRGEPERESGAVAALDEKQKWMLEFARRGAAFIRSYDTTVRKSLLDVELARRPAGQTKTVVQVVTLGLEARRLFDSLRASRSGDVHYFRVLPVIAETSRKVVQGVTHLLGTQLLGKPDHSRLAAALELADAKIGDAMFIAGSALWDLMDRDLLTAERKFLAAASKPSLVLTKRTSQLCVLHTRLRLVNEARARQPNLVRERRSNAIASIQGLLSVGVSDPGQCEYLYEGARYLEDDELALRCALRWEEVTNGQARAKQAREASLRRVRAAEASLKKK